jgi:hypothetical protein
VYANGLTLAKNILPSVVQCFVFVTPNRSLVITLVRLPGPNCNAEKVYFISVWRTNISSQLFIRSSPAR